jgi:hypothetical protein
MLLTVAHPSLTASQNGAKDTKRITPILFKLVAKVFRAKLLAAIEAAGLTLPGRYPKDWVVDCKSVGSGDKAIVYLGRYLYRGVIREQDIVAVGCGQVGFRYRNAKTGKRELRWFPGRISCGWCCSMCCPRAFGVPAISASCIRTASV